MFTRCFVLFFIQGDVGIRSIGVRKIFHARWTLWYIYVVKLDYKVIKQLWEWDITWFLCSEWSCSVCDEFVCVWQASDNCAPNIALWVLWLLAVLVLLLYYRRHVHGRPLISVTLRVCRLCSWAKLGNATHFNSRHWGRSFMPDILQMDFKSNFWKKLLLLDTNLKEVLSFWAQVTVNQQLSGQWLEAEQAKSYSPNQWWPSSRVPICVIRRQCVVNDQICCFLYVTYNACHTRYSVKEILLLNRLQLVRNEISTRGL